MFSIKTHKLKIVLLVTSSFLVFILLLITLLPEDQIIAVPVFKGIYVIKHVKTEKLESMYEQYLFFLDYMEEQGYKLHDRYGALLHFKHYDTIYIYRYPKFIAFNWFT
jgi:hypothetical protein